MPAAKLIPVLPSTTTLPPVMYSHAVVADAFDNGDRAAVPYGKAFAGHAMNISFSARCAVKIDVARNDIAVRDETSASFARIDDDFPAGKPFAHVVVRVALKLQRDARR